MPSTRVSRFIAAPRAAVYRALLDPVAVARWKVPEGMTCRVERFEPREGGEIRIALTYDAPDRTGKTSGRTDRYTGRFVRLVPDTLVVEVDAFDTSDPQMQGEMTSTIALADSAGGTELTALHDGVPPGVSRADNETGWKMALARLAELVERG